MEFGKTIRTFGLFLGIVCVGLFGYSIYEQYTTQNVIEVNIYTGDAATNTADTSVDATSTATSSTTDGGTSDAL